MSKPNIILLGAGGHSHAYIDVIELEGSYEIAGLVGHPQEIGKRLFGYAEAFELVYEKYK